MKKLSAAALILCLLLSACRNAPRETGTPSPTPPPASGSNTPSLPAPSAPETTPFCANEAVSPTPTATGEVFAPDLLIEEDSWQQDYRADDGTLLMSVSCAWPKLSGDFPASMRVYFSNRRDPFQQLAETTLAAARAAYDSQPESFVPYSIEQNYSVECNDGIYLSVLYEYSLYVGGAHGNETVETDTFRLADAAKLTLGNLFALNQTAYIDRLAPLICAQIAPNAEDYYPGYEQLVRDLFPTGTFCLTDTGLALFYQPYQLAPYTQGICRFDLPREVYEDIWKG